MARGLLTYRELYEAWPLISSDDRREGFLLLSHGDAEDLFDAIDARDQAELILDLPERKQRTWMRSLAPDDAADVVQEAAQDKQEFLLSLLDPLNRKEVAALLAYAEDEAGGLMNPRFARIRPDMTVDQAVSYLRRQKYERVESIYYAYVLDSQQRLLGVVSLGELIAARSTAQISEIMLSDLVTVREETDQEQVSLLFAQHDLVAIPVVDEDHQMMGVVTIDDIVDVVQEEATEDMHKLGGTEALDAPYLSVSWPQMLKKRLGWLATLLLMSFGAVLAMRFFEPEFAKATMLILFVPLIISSGGNSGSQAATLVVRAMALEEVRLRDWWYVIRRELMMGLMLGISLGLLGTGVVFGWHFLTKVGFGEHYQLVAATVGASVVCVALWGTVAGSALPFILRGVGFDPASASAPLVATIVDATGLVIFFTVASIILARVNSSVAGNRSSSSTDTRSWVLIDRPRSP